MNVNSKVLLAVLASMLCICSVGVVAMDEGADADFTGEAGNPNDSASLGSEDNPIPIPSSDLMSLTTAFFDKYESYITSSSAVYFNFESGSEVNLFHLTRPTSSFVFEVIDQGSLELDMAGTLSGIATGDFVLDVMDSSSDPSFDTRLYFIAVGSESVDFTSPDAIEAISKSTISYTAATNIPATFSEVQGSAFSWLDVDASTGKVTGQVPTVSSKTTYTYIIKATSTGDATNTAEQTITIDVWPIAQITASQRQFDVVQNDVFQGITLSGNIPMSYSVKSGEFPEGISMTSAGAISGTPTEYGQFTVTVQGTTSEGPEQNPTIVIVLNVDEDEPVLSITVGTPEGPYKVGTSLSFPLTSNVSGTTWQVSGDAASWMSVSGSNVVGSVPSSYDEITEVSLTVSAQTPQGQTSSQTITFDVEPVISFTTVPTADAVIIPVYEYNDDGTIVQSQALSLFDAVDAASAEFSFPDTLTVQGTFTGENADTVTWDWGDGSEIQTGNKFEHTYAEPGTYTITLTATNDVGSDVMELTITVGETGFGDLVFIGIIALLVLAVVYLLHRCGRHGRGRRD